MQQVWALPGVEVLGPGLQDVGEADDEVSQGDDGVGADHRQWRALQHGEQQARVLVAHRRTGQGELRLMELNKDRHEPMRGLTAAVDKTGFTCGSIKSKSSTG